MAYSFAYGLIPHDLDLYSLMGDVLHFFELSLRLPVLARTSCNRSSYNHRCVRLLILVPLLWGLSPLQDLATTAGICSGLPSSALDGFAGQARGILVAFINIAY